MSTAHRPSSAFSALTEEQRAFLQRRVARFGLVGASLGGLFLAIDFVGSLIGGEPGRLINLQSFYHLVAVSSLLLVSLLTSWGRRSALFVKLVESIGLVTSCIAYVLMGAYIPLEGRPEMMVLMALTLGMMARVVFVPSTWRHTLLLCVLIGVPVLALTYTVYQEIDPERLITIGVVPPGSDARDVASALAFAAGIWWICTTLVATSASRVIFGLRHDAIAARKLGQYTLEEKLGEGGMGAVYRASHAMLRRPTAVKLLPPDKSGEAAIERFEREVQLTAQLSHPNTVTVFDYGRTPDGVFYYAMELLEGAHLGTIVEVDGAQPASRVLHILLGAAAALREAHGIGLIHRDVKPGNIMLCERGGLPDVTKVVDFGLVKELDRTSTASLTQAESIVGTPQYMAPECITHPGEIDARSDLYALGAVGYFLLTGEHVFSGASLVEICSHHLHSEPRPPSEIVAGVPTDLEKILLDCLAKDPDDRPQTAQELLDRLATCSGIDEWTTRDATAWWSEFGELANRPSSKVSATTGTVNVDFAHRSGQKTKK